MAPAFTNKKRQLAYFNEPKQGFTIINKEMETELYNFQRVIETSFKQSLLTGINNF